MLGGKRLVVINLKEDEKTGVCLCVCVYKDKRGEREVSLQIVSCSNSCIVKEALELTRAVFSQASSIHSDKHRGNKGE